MAPAAVGWTAGSVKGRGAGDNMLKQLRQLLHVTIPAEPLTKNAKKLEIARSTRRNTQHPTRNTQHTTQKRSVDKFMYA